MEIHCITFATFPHRQGIKLTEAFTLPTFVWLLYSQRTLVWEIKKKIYRISLSQAYFKEGNLKENKNIWLQSWIYK